MSLSFVGVAGSAVAASVVPVLPDTVPSDVDAWCYRTGYRERAQALNRSRAVKLGIVGAMIPIALLVGRSARR